MEEYDTISSGTEVFADDYLKVDSVNSGGIAVARHVEVNTISSGGLVICETASQLESITSGGILICRHHNDLTYTPSKDTEIFPNLGAYLSALKQELEHTKNDDDEPDFFQETTEDDIEKVKRLMNEVDLKV